MNYRPRPTWLLLVACGSLFACLDSPTAPAEWAPNGTPALTAAVDGPISFAALAPGDEISIKYQSDGCFHHLSFRLTVRRDSAGAVVRPDSLTVDPAPGWHLEPRSRLTPAQLTKLDELLAFYRANAEGGCTTVDHIVLTAANGNDGVRREAYIDGSCATYERPDLLTLTQLIPIARDAPAGGPT